MAMSRKHYVEVARVLKDERAAFPNDSSVQDALSDVASALAGVFAADNRAFDRRRFLEATGVKEVTA